MADHGFMISKVTGSLSDKFNSTPTSQRNDIKTKNSANGLANPNYVVAVFLLLNFRKFNKCLMHGQNEDSMSNYIII